MNDSSKGLEQSDEATLTLEVSDEALEAAASATTVGAAAMSFPQCSYCQYFGHVLQQWLEPRVPYSNRLPPPPRGQTRGFPSN
jgi:hypothetical protein